ncbi:hypothetical protein K402DRAFT_322141 [Aulographum hederae CBS 113979]|uniref:L domain-like protein n=1 Tax=Aulographum hederae CBS 113979 TaxID=1176131 RepID=A0A6G1HFR2_9PEZI|nr:hypothetical protein K402DRAFT_322141 [Aulographum hederae CBS 113979]
MDSEDGLLFIKNLAYFVRTHEKALANALQLQRQAPRQRHVSNSAGGSVSPTTPSSPYPSSSSSAFASALSLPYLNFTSHSLKPAKLTLTPHHLFYLLSRFEELGVAVGPMNVRLENIHTDVAPTNYVSFLSQAQRNKVRSSDRDSMHSVSSIRSVMSGMSSIWSTFGLSKTAAKTEKQKAALKEDLKYLYSAFTKIPCLRLAPDHKARLIAGYEEFPFDTAVPLFAFKNLSALEICDVDFRQFHGWDRLADSLRSLTLKRASIDDPADLLVNIVLDDMDKRRKRSSKAPTSPSMPWPAHAAAPKQESLSAPSSPTSPPRRASDENPPRAVHLSEASPPSKSRHHRQRSTSPMRPSSSKHTSYSHGGRSSTPQLRRSSGSSNASLRSNTPRGSTSNLLSFNTIPSTKWRFLRHLSLADNGLTALPASSLAPLADTLQSFDLSSNLFTEIPDSLATLTSLRALNLSNNMIESLHSLVRNPLPAVTTLNLRHNRLLSLAGVERLFSLERVDFRDNKLTDPTELARLTGIPEIQEIFVNKNPFVKTHGSYRVSIFNLFRTTPGYTEDIIIDSSPPGYSERKQLVDRVLEAPAVPVVRPPIEEEQVQPDSQPVARPKPESTIREVVQEDQPAPSPQRSQSDYNASTYRRRKAPRRRIVELTNDDNLPKSSSESNVAGLSQAGLGLSADAAYLADVNNTPTKTRLSSEKAVSNPTVSLMSQPLPLIDTSTSNSDSVTRPSLDAKLTGDSYRQKIEALRSDFGNGWLSALSDDAWDNQQRNDRFGESGLTASGSLASPPLLVRTPSQGIVSGGRTLG